jgi:hypothetical protein
LGFAAMASGLTSTMTARATSPVETSDPDMMSPSTMITEGPIFPPVPTGVPSVLGMLLGNVSVINVGNGSTTYTYICPSSTSSSPGRASSSTKAEAYQRDWGACNIENSGNGTSIIGQSNLAWYTTFSWEELTKYDSELQLSTTLAALESMSITQWLNCPMSGSLISVCWATYTASSLNSAQSDQISFFNSRELSSQSAFLSSSPEAGNILTLGQVPVVAGTEKLSAATATATATKTNGGATASSTGKKETKANGAGKEKVLGTTFGLVAIALGIVIVT